ncbi:DUF2690 domain-containing protein [Streptomyces sp. NPDC090445]|uniref:DUF2690 domain-containing protein n=1 Tax=Streptomyces sp. NPDC090445 TaxID=3365963 RepID=UPI0037FA59EC
MDAQQNADAVDGRQPDVSARVRLARLLRSWREGNNRSQSWVAKQLHTNQPTVSRWESGSTLPAPESIREFRRICTAKAADVPPGDPELDQALALHRRAREERASTVPRQQTTAPLAQPDPQPQPLPLPLPLPHRSRQSAAHAAVAGAVVLLAAAVAWAGARYGGSTPEVALSPSAPASFWSPPAGARPAPTATCTGTSCASLEPAATTCAYDAVTALVGHDHGIRVELRHSGRCQAAWAKTSGTTAGDRVTVTAKQGNAQEHRQQYGYDAHTRMVPALTPGDARACALVDGRGTVCATEPPKRTGSGAGAPAAVGHRLQGDPPARGYQGRDGLRPTAPPPPPSPPSPPTPSPSSPPSPS